MSSIVVANWDVDGQASASMLIRAGYAETVFFPSVGYYWLEDEWLDALSGYDHIYIVDMHIPRLDISKLNTTSYVTIFNDSKLHPEYSNLNVTCVCNNRFSTTYILMDYLGIEPDVDAILGMYNDVGDNILTSEYWDIFSKYLDNLGINLYDLALLRDYFNAPYYINDVASLYRNVKLLMNRVYNRNSLPDFDRMMKIIQDKEEYVDVLIDNVTEKDGVIYLEYEGSMYVILDIAKKLMRNYPDKDLLIVDKGFIPGYYSIAVKSNRFLEPLIKKFMDMGLPAGGEGYFLGVVVPEYRYETLYEEITEYISIR